MRWFAARQTGAPEEAQVIGRAAFRGKPRCLTGDRGPPMKRVVGWVVFVAFLVSVGAFVYLAAGPVPRWRARVASDVSEIGVRLIDQDRKVAVGRFDQVSVLEPFTLPSGPVWVFDAEDGRELFVAPDEGVGQPASVVSPSRRWFAAIEPKLGQPGLRLVDLATLSSRRLPLGPGAIERVFFSPREDLLFAVRRGGEGMPDRLLAIDRETGKVAAVLPAPEGDGVEEWVGGWLVLSAETGWQECRLWDHVRRRPLDGLPKFLKPPAMSGDGRLVFGLEEGDVRGLWRLDDPARPVRVASLPDTPVRGATFSPDGQTVLFVRHDPEPFNGWAVAVEVWDARRGVKTWELPGIPSVYGFHFSPAGRYVLMRQGSRPAVLGVGGGTLTPGSLLLLDLHERRECWTEYRRDVGGDHSVTVLDERSVLRFDDAGGWHFVDLSADARQVVPGQGYCVTATATGEADRRQVWLVDMETPDFGPSGWRGELLNLVRWRSGSAACFRGMTVPGLRRVLSIRAAGEPKGVTWAADGSFVVTAREAGGTIFIERWDIPQPRPWAWIIATPFLVGAALLGLRWLWHRWQARRMEAES